LAKVARAHVEAFRGWMFSTRLAPTALNKHKGLRQQFLRWLVVDEEVIAGSPVEGWHLIVLRSSSTVLRE
jgi:hypothetical protein